MNIKVLGGGCSKCETLLENTKKAVQEKGIEAEIEYITDFSVIAGYGIMRGNRGSDSSVHIILAAARSRRHWEDTWPGTSLKVIQQAQISGTGSIRMQSV